jgi:general secretion pathway protein G
MTPDQALPLRSRGRPARSRPRGLPPRGLTVLELMLALAILGVLAALALPAYSNYQERVRVAQAITDIRDIGVKLRHYQVDNRVFPDDLGPVGMAAKLDPWGRPYQYLNLAEVGAIGKARKDKNLVPINSDFDLYSVGKDGASVGPLNAKASRDDVVRANDGRFVGLASDYDP